MALRRARVGDVIGSAVRDGAVTLLIAPPGYGKTIALRESLGDDPSVHWLELPAGARLEDVFRVIVHGLVPTLAGTLPALFDGSGEPKDFAQLVEWTARRLRDVRGTVVVDNMQHCSSDPAATAFLAQLIEASSSYVRWIAAGREVPDLPLGTWIARGLMTLPITSDDLAFTVDEAQALAHARGIDIGREVLDAIVEDCGGWPMAVHLALQLWSRTRSIVPLQMRTREVLFAHIEAEVWPHVTGPLRDIIACCALLPETTPHVLATAGFPDAERRLERAHHAVSFVQRTVDGGFRLHDVFGEFVLAALKRDPAELNSLRARLGRGLIAVGRSADALDVFIAGDDPERVLDVLADAGFALVEGGHRARVARALTFAAAHGATNHPVVAALRGVLSHADGNTPNAEALLRYAYERGLPPTMRVEAARRLATAYLNRGAGAEAVAILEPMVARDALSDDDRLELRATLAAALATAARPLDARASIDEVLRDVTRVTPGARARILQRLGFTAYYVGDLHRAVTLAGDAAKLAADLNLWYHAAAAHSVLYSATSLVETDSRIALEHARQTVAAAERAGDGVLAAYGLRAEYVLHAFRADEEAFDVAEARLSRFHDVRSFRLSFPARYARSLADASRGRLERAISTLSVVDARELSGAERALRDSMLALLYALANRTNDSATLLKAPLLLEATGDFVSRRYVNFARLTRAIALWCHDRTAQARRLFVFDAPALAENDRVLVDAVVGLCSTQRHLVPPAVAADTLERLRTYGWGAFARLIEEILAKADTAATLTRAEIRALRAFANGANTVQVASVLGKSPHTIEAQLKSAYKKIGCVSRAEALVYARARGWLDDHQRESIPESC